VLASVSWWQWLVAGAIFLAIAGGGFAFLKALTGARQKERLDPEDVAELDVFFVCSECGTEYQVTRLGEIQVPRHCGEPMMVVRRPRTSSLKKESE
jgi:DNA-directed RNA polymerase subunit RPC12/RpoP